MDSANGVMGDRNPAAHLVAHAVPRVRRRRMRRGFRSAPPKALTARAVARDHEPKTTSDGDALSRTRSLYEDVLASGHVKAGN